MSTMSLSEGNFGQGLRQIEHTGVVHAPIFPACIISLEVREATAVTYGDSHKDLQS
jgi:hypothetical protein